MTLMIIIGFAAALYALALLYRCATFALPVFVGLFIGLRLHGLDSGWFGPILAGLLAGATILALGRGIAQSVLPLWARLPVIQLFACAAAGAGYQAGTALASLASLEPVWQLALAILAGFVTACGSWRDLFAPVRGTEAPVSQA